MVGYISTVCGARSRNNIVYSTGLLRERTHACVHLRPIARTRVRGRLAVSVFRGGSLCLTEVSLARPRCHAGFVGPRAIVRFIVLVHPSCVRHLWTSVDCNAALVIAQSLQRSTQDHNSRACM